MKQKKILSSFLYKEAGIKHRRYHQKCEDSVFEADSEKTGVKVLSLSDGAGSYANVAIGSELISCRAAELFAEHFDWFYKEEQEKVATYVLGQIRSTLKEEALRHGHDLLSYSGTLLCVARHPDGRYLIFQVGDGAVVGYAPDKGTRLISNYVHNGPANQTTFVTIEGTDYHLIKGQGEYSAFVLMSDGPEEFLVVENQVHQRLRLLIQLAYFLPKEAMLEQLISLVQLLNDNGMRDDASFAILVNEQDTVDVFAGLNPQMKALIFDYRLVDLKAANSTEKKRKNMLKIIDFMDSVADGVAIDELTRKLYFRKPCRTKKVLARLIERKLVAQGGDGKYYLLKP